MLPFHQIGESTEEIKMRKETHKILGDPSIRVCTTTVRVTVLNGHSVSVNAEVDRPITAAQAREVLSWTAGVKVADEPKNAVYPMPIHASGKYDVLVGRIRNDPSVQNGLALWCSGDNIWKGAAQNAIQIAECLSGKPSCP